jgi:hypothetical protein
MRRLWHSALVVSSLIGWARPTQGQTTLMNRLLCPLSTPACLNFRVDYEHLQTGGANWDFYLRILQRPQYPTDPSWMTVNLFSLLFGRASGATSSNTVGVATYGTVLNLLGPAANGWLNTTDPAAVIAHADFYANPRPAVGGCTPAPNGVSTTGTGYATCTALDPNATIRFSFSSPYRHDPSLLRYAEVVGQSENGSWACNALTTGRTVSQSSSGPPENRWQCDVSDSNDPLTSGQFQAIVTPEPTTILLLAPGLLGCALLSRRGRAGMRRGATQVRGESL